MNVSRRLLLKVFFLTVLFSGILFFFFTEKKPLLPQIGDHSQELQLSPIRKWPYRPLQTGEYQMSWLLQQVDQDLNEIMQTLWLDEHESWFAEAIAHKKYDDMCKVFTSLCDRISWEWDFSRKQYYYYQWLFISLVRYLDTNVNYSPKASSTLDRLTLYKDSSGRRWGATHTVARINTQLIPTNREFREVLTHELGHIIDLWSIGGSMPVLDKTFTEFWQPAFYIDDPSLGFYRISRSNELVRKEESGYKDFVSGYAMQWPFEDLAETFNMYVNHYDLFVEMKSTSTALAWKFAFVDRLFAAKKWHVATSAKTANIDPEIRQRDTTKLYTLAN